MNNNTNINFYPGHMAKTKRLLEEKKELIDIVYELIDARIPYSSKINDIDNVLLKLPRILILTKCDLADASDTLEWVKYYEELGYTVVCISNDKDIKKIFKVTNEVYRKSLLKRNNKGNKSNLIHVAIVGIPNVGKSTLINKMAGRKVTNTGNMPGITKNITWLNTNSNIVILDTPGILWPKLEQNEVALNLASMSAIREDLVPLSKVCEHIMKKYVKYYPNILKMRYNLESLANLDNVYNILAKRFGAYLSKGEIDYKRIYMMLINDIKLGNVSGITFDKVVDYKDGKN